MIQRFLTVNLNLVFIVLYFQIKNCHGRAKKNLIRFFRIIILIETLVFILSLSVIDLNCLQSNIYLISKCRIYEVIVILDVVIL